MPPAVRLTDITKTFGDHTAVSELSLDVPPGALYGFIGPNGSGKTTTLRMILHIIAPDRGSLEVLGSSATRASNDRVGYLPEERGLYKKMTVRQLLEYYGTLKGMSPHAARGAMDGWLERFELGDWRSAKVESLSKGMSQKVQFISTVLAKPELLILDEPFSGLDPVNLEVVRGAILELAQNGTTVIFSTHDMTVAEQICDHIFMIFKGRKVLDGSMDQIKPSTVKTRFACAPRRGRSPARPAQRRTDERLGALPRAAAARRFAGVPPRTGSTHSDQALRRGATDAARHLHSHRRSRSGRRRGARGMKNKVLAIGRVEYLQAVRSKAFLIGLLLMPVLMGGGVAFQILMKDRVDLDERRFAIVDPTGELWPLIEQAVSTRNEREIWKPAEDDAAEPKQTRPKFLCEHYQPAVDERADLALSKRVREGELQGFLLVESDVLEQEGGRGEKALAYYTDEPTFSELPNWLERVLNEEIQERRFGRAGLDRQLVTSLRRQVPVQTWGLVSERSDGTVEEAEKENKLRTFGIPAMSMMLLFMLLMTSAPQLMNQVLEEKMQRISEVLVSAVSPFQLMLGKLLGSVGVSMTLAVLYLGGVFWATHHWDVAHFVPPSTYVWFITMLLFAMLMYGALFSALGSACSELRDAQSMMMPVMVGLDGPALRVVCDPREPQRIDRPGPDLRPDRDADGVLDPVARTTGATGVGDHRGTRLLPLDDAGSGLGFGQDLPRRCLVAGTGAHPTWLDRLAARELTRASTIK